MPEDPIEHVSSRPDYLVLGYPWIGAISSDTSHLCYCKLFDLMDQCEALRCSYSPDLFFTKDTPPRFIYHTFNDQTVPVEQSLRFYNALSKAGVPVEMHIGPHGTGLGLGDETLDQWPGLLEVWLRGQGLLNDADLIRRASYSGGFARLIGLPADRNCSRRSWEKYGDRNVQ